MANYPSSGSTLRSNISTGLSTQILVKVGTETVGAIQKLSIAHSRNLNRVKELGLDGILENKVSLLFICSAPIKEGENKTIIKDKNIANVTALNLFIYNSPYPRKYEYRWFLIDP